jgi:peptidoglycan hydrolase FlgJ
MVAPFRPGLAAGGGSLEGLRGAARTDPKGAIKEAAKQFEALFMQEIMKSMRATTMSGGMLNNSGTELGTSLLDQQYAVQMSGQPGGLADAIARQLERQAGLPAAPATPGSERNGRAVGTQAAMPASTAAGAPASAGLGHAQSFVAQHSAAARAVAASSGIPATFMLSQAAHETGWGRRTIKGEDGRPSHNLFGIKAGGDWTGPTVTATTTEVYDGRAVKVQAKFRAYASSEESFRDYARLISQSPRYSGVMNEVKSGTADGARFAQGLQKAGYATDPDYARKLSRVIDTTVRLQRQMT